MHDLDAGIGHQNIHAAEFGDNRRHTRIHLLFARHIHGDAHGVLSGGVHGQGRSACAFQRQIGNGHFRALTGIKGGNGPAKAAGCAGDDGGFSGKLHGMVLLLRCRRALCTARSACQLWRE